MTTFKITLAYDGTSYVGWQRQASGTSIQGLIEDALQPLSGRRVVVTGAGRTDAGVHAAGQVASFTLDRAIEPDALARALNAVLPPDVRIMQAEAVPGEFHARFDASAKTYRYRFCDGAAISPFDRRFAWHVAGALDCAAMDTAARLLEGHHDFAAFATGRRTGRSTERTVLRSRVSRASPEGASGGIGLIVYDVTGDGFLRHMVRSVAGTLAEIGRGRWTAEQMRDVLLSRDRRRAGPTAPARGLFLVAVEYGDL